MQNFFDRKKLSLPVILACSCMIAAFYGFSCFGEMSSTLELLGPVFDEKTPVVILQSGSIEFDRPVPYHLTLENGVEIFFDETADDSVFAGTRPYSLFIAKDQILFKTKKEIKKIAVDDIEIEKEPFEVNPVRAGRFLHKFFPLIFAVAVLLSFLALFLIFYLIAAIAAGMGIMIDAFSNGPYSFGALLNGSSLLLLLFSLIWLLFGLSTIEHLRLLLIAYFFIFTMLVYSTIKSSKRIDVS